MSLAIFGISNSGLNLAVSLLLLIFVVVWLALIVYTYLDAKRRIADPFLVACATIASFFPYIGTAVYAIVRPPEFLEDAHERELEIKAADLRVRQLTAVSCPNCENPIERDFLRCPSCQHRLKDPCPNCGKPVAPAWKLCPFCEAVLGASERRPRRGEDRSPTSRGERSPTRPERPAARAERPTTRKERPAAREERPMESRPVARKQPTSPTKKEPAARASSKEAPSPTRQQRSPSREPDPDPRQA
jgi:hypothetical protein